MKIITLWQPWATLIALGLKEFETRHWGTICTGPLLIHAAKRKIDKTGEELLWIINELGYEIPTDPQQYPLGVIVALTELKSTKRIDKILINNITELEEVTGSWQVGRYAWEFADIKLPQELIQYRGQRGIHEIDPLDTRRIQSLFN